jgi:hypothetical protein
MSALRRPVVFSAKLKFAKRVKKKPAASNLAGAFDFLKVHKQMA